MKIAKRYPSEHVEQRNFVKWFRQTHKGVWIFAIPNGEKRSPSVAARLKAEGVSPGVPDLYIPAWKLWVEMKRQKGGRLSEDQKKWRNYLIEIGDTWVSAKGCEEAKEIIKQYLTNNLK